MDRAEPFRIFALRRRTLPLIVASLLVLAGGVLIAWAVHGTRRSGRWTVPPGIDATGATDVTYELNAFLRSLPPGAVVVFPHGAVYRAEGTVLLFAKHGLTLDGYGATLEEETTGAGVAPTPGRGFKWPRQRCSLLVQTSTDVSIRGLTIIGPNDPGGSGSYRPALEAQAGVDVEESTDVTITGTDIRHVYGDFVYVGGRSRDVRIVGNTFAYNGRQGVSVTDGRDVLISHNRLSAVARSAFDLEPNTAGGEADGVTIADNTVSDARLSFVAAEGMGPNVDDVSVVDNHLQGFAMDIFVRATDGARRRDWKVTGNTDNYVVGSPIAPMEFFYVSDLTISHNVMPMAADRPSVAVYLVDPCGWRLTANSFPGAERREPQGIEGACTWK